MDCIGVQPQSGLCAYCQHARIVRTARSTFWLCERSREDPAFARYPRLPVLHCRGYEAHAGDADERDTSERGYW